MFNFFKKKPQKPPSKKQFDLCEQLGLEVKPKMSREDVAKLLEVSLQQEKYKKIFNEIQKEREDECEEEDRAMYGDDLYDELKKWEQYCDPYKQYILLFKRGGKIQADVVEFETAEIIGEKKYSIQLGILLPKLHKDRDGDYIEWEKEITLKPSQVLKIEQLMESIDMFDIETYKEIKTKCEAIANEFQV